MTRIRSGQDTIRIPWTKHFLNMSSILPWTRSDREQHTTRTVYNNPWTAWTLNPSNYPSSASKPTDRRPTLALPDGENEQIPAGTTAWRLHVVAASGRRGGGFTLKICRPTLKGIGLYLQQSSDGKRRGRRSTLRTEVDRSLSRGRGGGRVSRARERTSSRGTGAGDGEFSR